MRSWEMNIALGFDGGGTKTDCVVLNAEGKMLGRGVGGPSNPLRVGFDAAFKGMADAAAEALAGAHLKPRQIHTVCAGLAGGSHRTVVRKVMLFLAREFPDALSLVTTDYEVALEAAVGPGPGVVLLAGTGSVAFGRNAAGEKARAGGFGPWVGDEGSAYEMGRRAVAAVSRSRDQGETPGPLGQMVLAALDVAAWEQITERIANHPDDVFPRLFPAVAAAADAQDDAAREILFTSAEALSGLAMTVARRLGLLAQEFPLVESGGVFGVSGLLDGRLDSALSSAAPLALISRLQVPAATGAARLAARLAAADAPLASRSRGAP